jgi:hypothetical protein
MPDSLDKEDPRLQPLVDAYLDAATRLVLQRQKRQHFDFEPALLEAQCDACEAALRQYWTEHPRSVWRWGDDPSDCEWHADGVITECRRRAEDYAEAWQPGWSYRGIWKDLTQGES